MIKHLSFQILLTLICFSLNAAYGPPSTNPLYKPGQSPTQQPQPAKQSISQPSIPADRLPPKSNLPLMTKPFGLPGVIGLQDGKWIGTDYLGYLTNRIGIDVEILKPDAVQQSVDTNRLRDLAIKAFEKWNLTPSSESTEGPPLPFLHFLVTIFPCDRDRFVVIGNARLFEQVQVVRKDFTPTGYWQGITWENQDIVMANAADLNTKIEGSVSKLAEAFGSRYRQYNAGKSDLPPGTPR